MSKKTPPGTSAEKGSGQPLPLHEDRAGEIANTHPLSFSRIFGALKGTVTIRPDVDLTQPTGEKWDAEE